MKKEVIYVPLNKDLLKFIEEKFGKNILEPWFYIDRTTINILSQEYGVPYNDIKGKLHIPYGNIIIDGYRFEDYSWYRINSFNSDNVTYSAVADPKEIFFISIR